MNRRSLAFRTAVVALLALLWLQSGTLYQVGGSVESDQTVTRVELEPDTDAVFTVEIRTRLENGSEREAFDRLRSRIKRNTSRYLESFAVSVRRLVSRVENTTNRSMNVSGFSVETRVQRQLTESVGVVEYSFDWSNFSRRRGNEILVDGILSGYILSGGDALVFSYPGMSLETVEPQPSSTGEETVRWNGPYDFASDEPRLVLRTQEPGFFDTPNTSPGQGLGPVHYVAAGILIAALVAGGVYYWRHRPSSLSEITAPDTPSSETEAPVDSGGDDGAGEEHLSDEERVMRIVDSEGRVKQKEVVEKTGWSPAKVSQVTSRLEESGEIEKLRMGRENIIKHPEEEEEDDDLPK